MTQRRRGRRAERSHAPTFPRGKLGLERDLLSVEALRRLGRTPEARSRAGALAARARGTIYEERARSLSKQLE